MNVKELLVPFFLTITFLLGLIFSANEFKVDSYSLIDFSISYENNIFSRSLAGWLLSILSEAFRYSFVDTSLIFLIFSLTISFWLFLYRLKEIGFDKFSMIFITLLPFSYAFYLNNFSYVILRRDILLVLLFQAFYFLIRGVKQPRNVFLLFLLTNIVAMLIHIMSLFIVLPISTIILINQASINVYKIIPIWILFFLGFFVLTYMSSNPTFAIQESLLSYGINYSEYQEIVNKIGSQNANSLITELKIFIINFPYFALASIFFLLSFYTLTKLPIKFKIFEYIFFIGFGVLMLIAHDHGRFFAMLFILFFYAKDDIFKKKIFMGKKLNKFLVATLLIFSCLFSFPHYFGLPIIQNSFLTLIIS